MKRFLMLTLLAFVASCERAAVREYVAPKQTFPHTAAVREEIEQAQNSAPTHAESGGLLANINRWRGQLGLNAVDAEQLESTVERRNLGGREFVIVDFVNEESPADKKQRIIGAVVPASGETWFFKMTGGDALTAAQKSAFLEVLESVEFRSQ